MLRLLPRRRDCLWKRFKVYNRLDRMTTERDIRNQMIYAREEGREEGIALAIKNMAESGLNAEQIAEIMKMSVADVQAMIS